MADALRRTVSAGADALKKHRDRHFHKFSPLTTKRREIRVIVLLHGRYNDELRVEMRNVNLDDDSRLRYEAVSHFCASTTGEPDILKVGTAGRRIYVQPTVGVMLRHLRYRDEARILWVDVISVNQGDIVEKSQQASMTAGIFKAADRSVVWLGPEGADSGNAFSLLEDLGEEVEFDFDNLRMRPVPGGTDDPSWADPDQPLNYDQDDIWAVYELIYRSWFGRVGSRQEIAASNPTSTIVCCGLRTIRWDILRSALGCFANKPREHLGSEDSAAELRFARRYEIILLLCHTSKVYTLADLLEQSRKFSASNPLDRVYTVMGLATDVDLSISIVPDYSLTKERLYQDVVIRYIASTRATNILASSEATSAPRAADEMPSWVPDWGRKRKTNPMPLHFASSHSEAYVAIDLGVLKVHGVKCCTVKSAQPLFSDFVPLAQVVSTIRRCAPDDVATAFYQGGKPLLEAYCGTLACGLFQCLHSPMIESYPDHPASIVALRNLLNDGDDSLDSSEASLQALAGNRDALTYITHVLGCCKGRALFTTDDGLIGLTSKEVLPRDQVWAILGCDVPLVLRQAKVGSGWGLNIIGDSYVHGLMAGEALLGPFAPGHRLVFHGTDDNGQSGPVVWRRREIGTVNAPVAGTCCAGAGADGWVKLDEDPRMTILREDLGLDLDTSPEEVLVPEKLRFVGMDVTEIEIY